MTAEHMAPPWVAMMQALADKAEADLIETETKENEE